MAHNIKTNEDMNVSEDIIYKLKIAYLIHQVDTMKVQHQQELMQYDYKNSKSIREYTQQCLSQINRDIKLKLYDFFEELQRLREEKELELIKRNKLEKEIIELRKEITGIKVYAEWDQQVHREMTVELMD